MKLVTFIKVLASYLILIALTIAVLDFFLVPKIRDTVTKSIEDEMFGIARAMTLMPAETIRSRIPYIAAQVNARITLIDQTGRVIRDSQADAVKMDNHLNRPEIQQARTEGRGKASRFSVTLQESMLYVALPLQEGSTITGYIRLARPLVEVTESLRHLNQTLSLTLYIISIPSLLLALLFAGKITAQLNINSQSESMKE